MPSNKFDVQSFGDTNNALSDLQQQISGVSDDYGPAVQDIPELTAVPYAGITDRQQRFVEDERVDYFYNKQSMTVPDGFTILLPDDQNIAIAGRWIRLAANMSNIDEGYIYMGNAVNLAEAMQVRSPKYDDLVVRFEPTFDVDESAGGDFAGSNIVEKGYAIPKTDLVWATQAGGLFPLDNSDELKINSAYNELDASPAPPPGNTGGSLIGGVITHAAPLSEGAEGTGFDVRLHSGAEQEVKNAVYTWRWRHFYFADARAALTEGEIQDIIDMTTGVDHDALRSGRAGTFNFDASGSKYLWFIWNQALGAASSFIFAGLPTTFIQTIPGSSKLNQYGDDSTYYLYRSLNIQTGSDLDIIVN